MPADGSLLFAQADPRWCETDRRVEETTGVQAGHHVVTDDPESSGPKPVEMVGQTHFR